jgi:rubrerythrin
MSTTVTGRPPGRWAVGRSDASIEKHRRRIRARSKALTRLARRHPDEFQALLADTLKELGGYEPTRPMRSECRDCGLPTDGEALCEFCEDRGAA